MIVKDNMGAELNNAQEGVQTDKNVVEIEHRLIELTEMMNEIKILRFKFKFVEEKMNNNLYGVIELGSRILKNYIFKVNEIGRFGTIQDLVEFLGKEIFYCKNKMNEIKNFEKDKKIEELKYYLEKHKKEYEETAYALKKYSGYIGKGFYHKMLERIICFRCQQRGHKVKNCTVNVRYKAEYYKVRNYDYKRSKLSLTPLTLGTVENYFKNEFETQDGKIKFCKIEKCKLNTVLNKKVQEKCYIIPKALENNALLYIKD
ncbi:hypothetical protein GVAV_001152 [Gurleya vavrai]